MLTGALRGRAAIGEAAALLAAEMHSSAGEGQQALYRVAERRHVAVERLAAEIVATGPRTGAR